MPFWSNPSDSSPARKYRFKLSTVSQTDWWYASSATLPSFEINVGEYIIMNQKVKIPGTPTWNDVTITVIDTPTALRKIKDILDFQNFSYVGRGDTKVITAGGYLRDAVRKTFPPLTGSIREPKDVSFTIDTKNSTINPGSTRTTEALPFDFGTKRDPRNRTRYAIEVTGAVGNIDMTETPTQNFTIEQLKDSGGAMRTWTLYNSFIKAVNYGDLNYGSDELNSLEIIVTYDYACFSPKSEVKVVRRVL